MTSGLRWKLERLRSMSPAEVAWRLEDRLSLAFLEARSGRHPEVLPAPREGFQAAWRGATQAQGPETPDEIRREFPGEIQRTVAEAQAIMAGQVPLFARTYAFGPDPVRWPWNRDPDGGAPIALDFGPTLDYRDLGRVGNARLTWELGRHQWTAPVAQAAFLTGEERYARFVVEVLESWCEACPPFRGIQWSSGLEFALRAFAWGWALALVARTPFADRVEDARWARLFATWAAQMRFVREHDSRYSSANNHRLGEAAGLAWSGMLLPFVAEAAGWRTRGLEVLEEGFLAQTTPEGVTREHAFAYQHFVLDFVVVVEGLARAQGRTLPRGVAGRIDRVAAALAAFTPGVCVRAGATWPVGDGDEGRALHLGEPWEERVSASLECAARLTGRPWDGPRHARAAWLAAAVGTIEPSGPSNGEGGSDTSPPPPEGYAIESWPTPHGEAHLLFDAAPLGLPPLYAHGHADALMLLLDVGGPRLVDPGTGGYHAQPALRERLRSTRAHNTVEVDGQSQSVPGGLFQWRRPARILNGGAQVRGPRATIEAAHDGYARFGDPVIHRRAFRVHAPDTIVVVDALEGASRHRAVARWHVGDGVPREAPGHVLVGWEDGFELAIAGFGPGAVTAHAGAPVEWAPRFLEPRPCGVVELEALADLPLTFVSVITIGASTVTRSLENQDWILRVATRAGETTWRVRTGPSGPSDRRLERISHPPERA